ncbi:Carboxypeptidase [Nesidiocoris tenuis]|uniref:Carboxypeptidase n=1 Tax=Nesidiocoris tenuis TaxID=355587 RepID=A0ABN7BHP6_9HEMI|nr:Carboxypeptidase [Nesidiocoris tenuis]
MNKAIALLFVVASAFCQEEQYDYPENNQNEGNSSLAREQQKEDAKLDYHTFEQINHFLLDIERQYNETVKAFEIGHSVEGRPIRGVRISSPGNSQGSPTLRKPAIILDAGMHAREWIAPVVALYTIQQLLGNSSNLTDGLDWYILPMLNPDGYVYSMDKQEARLWRKNRARSYIDVCDGVDLNRNFGYVWGGPGSSDEPCSSNYRGPYPFSEPEAVAFARFVLSIAQDVKMYLTLHSAAQAILYPWGYTELVPQDWQELDALARKAEAAMSQVNGTRYHVGPTTKLVGLGAGGSDDWAKGAVGIKYVYTLELPGLFYPERGFHPPTETLPIIAREAFEGIKIFAEHAKNKRP